MMKLFKLLTALAAVLLLGGCGAAQEETGAIAATTAPVAQFAQAIVAGTELQVEQVIADSVSCLHDYSLSVNQMKILENSKVVLISGAGLEGFMEDALKAAPTVVDCSQGIALREMTDHGHEHAHGQEDDPHIWLDPDRAAQMAENICQGLSAQYPDQAQTFRANTDTLQQKLAELKAYGQEALRDISCRKLITFHDGFSYFAEAFDLEILASVEEEAGSEASAADLMEIIALVQDNQLPAVFTEVNGADAAAKVICSETTAQPYQLNMAMGGTDYFEAMKTNLDTLKEALQ